MSREEQPSRERLQVEAIRYRILQALICGQPFSLTERTLFALVAGKDFPISELSVRNQVNALELAGCVMTTGDACDRMVHLSDARFQLRRRVAA